ncbi:MAG: prepilin-type N-terminal cleavage/methylation domain-containing protein [Planctomycetota bacterium]|nr:prepilin-type N-terminal cleavage/methylation domain-containing protein [Planctomycetota bacterium]MDP6989118.1 prepilin-type N-terminal cleavage/methylation domain-containing protein [Planctomycetota bacterium]
MRTLRTPSLVVCPRRSPRGSRAGFTVLEILIATAIFALVLANVTMVSRTSQEAYRTGAFMGLLEEQAEQTMDRIEMAVMSSEHADLAPVAPLFASSIDYERSLGVEEGQMVFDDPERIELELGPGQVSWLQNPQTAAERKVVWTRHVPEYMQDELPNAVDDNGNGLVDESGLSFDMEGKQVSIRLTLRREDAKSRVYTRMIESRVTCRN